MRRDLNGKLDGDGIKRGELSTSIAGALTPIFTARPTAQAISETGEIVGTKISQIAESAKPQTLQTLGGLPEISAVSSTVSKSKASVDIRKFSEYIFKPNADHGKDVVFKSLGYTEKDSAKLTQI